MSGYLPDAMDIYTMISMNISFTVDAVIYIFMQDSVRKLLYKKLYPKVRNAAGPVQQPCDPTTSDVQMSVPDENAKSPNLTIISEIEAEERVTTSL